MKTRTLKLILPAAGLMTMVGVAWAMESSVQVTTATPATASPSATPSTDVTVNGKAVPLDATGHAAVTTPSGTTKIRNSDGQTTVTTTGPANSTNTFTSSGNVSLTVNQTSNTSSQSYTSTSVSGSSSGSSFNSFYSSSSDGTGGGIGN